jgi:hypothetical protein
MALYTVTTGNTALAADLNQVVNLLNGSDTATQLTISNRIRAQMTGATTASGYVGGAATGHPTTGTFVAGDFIVTQDGVVWVCISPGSPGTWVRAGVVLDTTASDIQALGASAVAGSIGQASDAGHVHPYTGLAVLANAQSFNALQTFTQGVALTGAGLLTLPSYNGSAWATSNGQGVVGRYYSTGSRAEARQLFTANSRNDAQTIEGDILFSA